MKGYKMAEEKGKNAEYKKCLKCGEKIYADGIKYFDNTTKTICPHCGVTMLIYIDNTEIDKVKRTIFKKIIRDI